MDRSQASTAANNGGKRQIVWPALAIAIYLLAWFLPPAPGLNPSGQAVLGTVVCGMLLWMSEAAPQGVTALFVLALLGAVPDTRPTAVFAGFTSPVVFFLIGVLVIGHAVEHTGLAARIARALLVHARGSPTRLYFQMLLGWAGMAFIVPSAITRNAILIPAYQETLRSMGIGDSHRAGRALMLALGVLHPLASSALLTGGITSMTTATLLGGISWFHWFALMALPYYLLLLTGAILLWAIVGSSEPTTTSTLSPRQAGTLSSSERRTLMVLGLTFAVWLTDSLHGLSPSIPALLAAGLLLSPQIGVLGWSEFEARTSWGLIFTVGASLSLTQALNDTGAAAWLGRWVVYALTSLGSHPLIVVVVLIVMVATIHLAITNLAACLALLIPIATSIGREAGLNPLACGLIVTIVVDAVIFYPVQTATSLLAYETGYFNAADVRWFGLAMLVLTIGMVVGVILPYWSLVGLSLTTAG